MLSGDDIIESGEIKGVAAVSAGSASSSSPSKPDVRERVAKIEMADTSTSNHAIVISHRDLKPIFDVIEEHELLAVARDNEHILSKRAAVEPNLLGLDLDFLEQG